MKQDTIVVLHICNYATPYRGSFIASLEHLGRTKGIKNIYLFPHRAIINGAESWISSLNEHGQCAYIQHHSFWATVLLLKTIINLHHADCVITHFLDRRVDVMLFFLFGHKRILRFVRSYFKLSKLKRFIASTLWRGNIFVGISQPLTDLLKKEYRGIKCVTIENSVDFDRLDFLGCGNERKSSNQIRLMCMGYDINVKGTDLAIIAANRLRASGCNVKLRIVAISDVQKKKIKTFLSESAIDSDWIEILPPTQNIAAYYNNTDIFLSPSRSEAFGNAVLEAAYSGNAIVASRVGGQATLEVEGAYWFSCDDVNGLYDKLSLAVQELSSPEKKFAREKAAQHISERYSCARWCDAVLSLVQDVVCKS